MNKTSIRKCQTPETALANSTKTVNIKISDEEIKNLKENDYKLCFAKKIGGTEYDIVWQAYSSFLSKNVFSWTPEYQLFGSDNFISGTTVATQTNNMIIGLGKTSILDKNGLLNTPTSGGQIDSIAMDNKYGNIYPGVNQMSTGIDGSKNSTPIYVAQKASIKGITTSLTPMDKIIVWFQQGVETSTMFSDAVANPEEIDFSTADSVTRLYSNGQWTTV